MTSTSTDWLARAHEFGPIIQKYRDEAEQARHGTSPRFMRSHCGVGCWRDNGKRLVLYPRHGLTTSCASRVYETGRRTSETDFAPGA
jgi:hypothetical protein